MIVDKFYNEDFNAFNVTATIIKLMENEYAISIDNLFTMLDMQFPGSTTYLLFESLGLLFLTNKIDYDPQNDKLVGVK